MSPSLNLHDQIEGQWRRGDSNPKRTETEPLHTQCNSDTNPNRRPLKGGSEEQNSDSSEHFQTLLQHKLGANMVHENGSGPDLAKIMEAWPELPEHIKTAIKALIQTHKVE